MEAQETSSGILLRIRVNPDSGKFRFYEKSGKLVIDVRSRPEKGMANRGIVTGLGKLLGKEVEVVRGQKSRDKLILVRGVSLADVRKALESEHGKD